MDSLNLGVGRQGVQFFAEEVDVIVQVPILNLCVRPPYISDNLHPCQGLVGIAEEIGEEGGFLRR